MPDIVTVAIIVTDGSVHSLLTILCRQGGGRGYLMRWFPTLSEICLVEHVSAQTIWGKREKEKESGLILMTIPGVSEARGLVCVHGRLLTVITNDP